MTDKYFFNNQSEMQDEIWRLRKQRDQWQKVAEIYERLLVVVEAYHGEFEALLEQERGKTEGIKRALQP